MFWTKKKTAAPAVYAVSYKINKEVLNGDKCVKKAL